MQREKEIEKQTDWKERDKQEEQRPWEEHDVWMDKGMDGDSQQGGSILGYTAN